MAYSYTTKKGKVLWLHERKNARGGQMRWFSADPKDAVDLPAGFTVIEGPTGLPFAKRTNTTGV